MAKGTKKRIIDAALILFSQKGYDATSMAEIADNVGIKAPSLYVHFRSKQDLFQSMVEVMRAYFWDSYPSLHTNKESIAEEAREIAESIDLAKKLSVRTFQFYFNDKYAGTFRRLLSIERYHNLQMDIVYRELYLEAPISNQTQLFDEMKKQGYLSANIDSHMAAIEFYSPFIFLMSQYDGKPEQEEVAICELEEHVEQFMKQYLNV